MRSAMDTMREIRVISGKELRELRRQKGLLVLVVLGPFLVLAAFGIGYRNEEIALRTLFVGPAGSQYEDAIQRYSGAIKDYVVPVGFTSDFLGAARQLREGRVDLMIVLPPTPVENLQEGRRSEVAVLHNSIDPIERIGIQFATEIAVRELNASVVTAALDTALTAASDLDTSSAELLPLVDELERANREGDDLRTRATAQELRRRVLLLEPSLALLDVTGADQNPEQQDDPKQSQLVSELTSRLDRLIDAPGDDSDELNLVRRDASRLEGQATVLLNLDAAVLARPFRGDAESLVRGRVSAEDHVAPGATALLIQHLGVSLAALSLVRDHRRGVLTEYRVGPTGALSMMLGKLISLSLVGLLAAVALIGAQTGLLGIPMRGSFVDLALVLVLLVGASVTTGLVLAAIGRTELQASQASMIVLLIALFFSGFAIDVELIRQPFRAVGLLASATPAVEGLRDVQLRGTTPADTVHLALAGQLVIGSTLAWALLRRRWKEAL